MSMNEHHPLRNGDILSQIFFYCDRGTNAFSARVCHTWAEYALDKVWRELGSPWGGGTLTNLVEILMPLSEIEDGDGLRSKVFADEVDQGDWARFEFYARRVRSLHITTDDNLDKSVFVEIGCFRPMYKLFPNLDQLCLTFTDCAWSGVAHDVGLYLPRYSTMVLHEGIRTMQLDLPHLGEEEIGLLPRNDWQTSLMPRSRLFSQITSRAPNIVSLTVNYVHKNDVVEAEMVRLVNGLERLRRICVPPCALTPAIFASMAYLPNVKQIERTNAPIAKGSLSDPSNDIFKTFSLPSDLQFYALETLHIVGVVRKLRPIFDRLTTPTFPELTCLCVSMLHCALEREIKNLVHALVSACPRLEDLELKRDVDHALDVIDLETEPLSATTLKPLVKLPFLRRLAIEYSQPVAMNDDEVVDFLTSAPSLHTLHLVHEPFVLTAPTLTIDVLHKLALQGSSVKELALYIDASEANCWTLASGCHLPELTALDFGDSPEPDDVDVAAICLSQYLPFAFNPSYRSRLYLPTDAERPQHAAACAQRRNRWTEVQRLLHFAERARMKDLERITELENRVEELEAAYQRGSKRGGQRHKFRIRDQID